MSLRIAALILLPLLLSASALAQESSGTLYAAPLTGTPSSGTAPPATSGAAAASTSTSLTLNNVCGSTLQQASNPTAADNASMTFSQKVAYCQAAQQAQKASNDDALLWKVWAGVAGVCTTACLTSLTGVEHLKMVCTATNIGASVTSAIMTQNFESALMGLAPTAIGVAVPKGAAGAAGKKKADLAGCLSAATATMQVFTIRKDETAQQSTLSSNLSAANQLGSDPSGGASSSSGGPGTIIVPTPTNSGTPATVVTTSGAPQLTVEKATLAQAGGAGDICGGSDAGARFACALAKDSNLPGFVGSPGFNGELSKNTGMDPNQYLNSGQTPAQAILGATGGAGLTGSGLQNYAGLLGDLAKQFDSDTPSAVYAGGNGGGGEGRGSGDDSAALTTAMAGLMKQLDPRSGEKEKSDGNSLNVVFQSNRTPAYNADDPSFSIFDRVSVRYRYISQRLSR